MTQITYEIVGLEKILKHTTAPASLLGPPLRKGLTASALLVEGEAKRLVPVDTGNLRRTITHRVDSAAMPTFAQIGTNASYAVYVHEGRRAGSMPPTKALLGWASRHGANPFLVARAIGRRGIKARPFLRDAMTQMRSKIESALSGMARDIESRWGKG